MSLRRTILCVDNDQANLGSFRKILREEPYLLLTSSGAEEAVGLLDANSVNVILVDAETPDEGGIAFLRALRETHPNVVRVVFSRDTDVDSVVDAIVHGDAHRFLIKPWKEQELCATMRQCLEYYDLVQENRDMVRHIKSQNEELFRLNENLEEEISRRTRSLELSQDILTGLPVAVLGISREGLIVCANEAVGKSPDLFEEPTTGSSMRECLPSQVVKAVERTLSTTEREDFKIYGGKIRVRTSPLIDNSVPTGCIVVMEDM